MFLVLKICKPWHIYYYYYYGYIKYLSSRVIHMCVYWEKLKNDKKVLATLAVVILTVLVSAMQGRLREVFP